jgi:hypothetical protein
MLGTLAWLLTITYVVSRPMLSPGVSHWPGQTRVVELSMVKLVLCSCSLLMPQCLHHPQILEQHP